MLEDPRFWAVLTTITIAMTLTVAVIWLFYGWKCYRLFTTILTTSAAAMVGWFFVAPYLPDKIGIVAPVVLGLAGMLASLLLLRVMTFAATGLLGAAIGAAVGVAYFNVPLDIKSGQFIAIASAGFLVAGIPAAIFHRFLIIFMTSGWGAALALAGAVSFFLVCVARTPLENPTADPSAWFQSLFTGIPVKEVLAVSVFAWIAITIVGVVFQYRMMGSAEEAK